MAYRPTTPYSTALILLIPQYSSAYGVASKAYPLPGQGELIYGSFRSFGGTETTADGVYSVEDTATVETWYRPDIKADCRIAIADDPSAIYEIVGTPEDVEMRHQFCLFHVRRVKGGA